MSIRKRALNFDNNTGTIKTVSDVSIPNFKGSWVEKTPYSTGDIVSVSSVEGKGFISKSDNNQINPLNDNEHVWWDEYILPSGEDTILSLGEYGGIRIGSGDYIDPLKNRIDSNPVVYPMDGVVRMVKDKQSGMPVLQTAYQGKWQVLAQPVDEAMLIVYAIMFSA